MFDCMQGIYGDTSLVIQGKKDDTRLTPECQDGQTAMWVTLLSMETFSFFISYILGHMNMRWKPIEHNRTIRGLYSKVSDI